MTAQSTEQGAAAAAIALGRRAAPGLVLSAVVAIAAVALAPLVARVAPIPAMVLALLIGIAANRVAARPVFQPGLVLAVKTILRWAVALLGLRIALGDILALGVSSAALVVVAMIATVIAGFVCARAFGMAPGFGALVGAGTAVCGASATLATATVVPPYPGREADIAFVVVAVNALSTLAMVLYPPLAAWLGFDAHATGILLGGTIHDVAQVVGAGYAVSEPVGNTAVIVKLFRVFLLLPMILAIGWWLVKATPGTARAPVPVFALVFLALCVVNTIVPGVDALAPIYAVAKDLLVSLTNAMLLLAIAALGLGTSLAAMRMLGWRHLVTVCVTTVVILAVVTAGLVAIG
ncbi:YeiH family protein [Rhodoplanes roseus]|uniref:YeiH family protein n=1 Tax=Rhodoplanes roseus TaxID=29409 RepID=UPI001FDF418B|nr:putative sulfate exporter family transporter [Rhodoplanes roseus]